MGARLLYVIALASAALLLVVGQALARPVIPPGYSGANQYNETLPGPGGNEPTGGAGGRGVPSPKQVLGAANAARLEALGAAGKAAARVAAETAPQPVGQGPRGARGGSAAEPSGASGVGQVIAQVAGSPESGGMGILLPILIGLTGVGAGWFALRRRRRVFE